MANKTQNIIETQNISTQQLRKLFSGGRIASVAFVKKSDGSTRILNGKLSVQSALKGGEASYDAESRGQLRVCDLNVYKDNKGNKVPRHSEFRSVTAQNVLWVTSRGVKYVITNQESPQVNFVQSIQYSANGTLSVKLDGVKYEYYNVTKRIHRDFVESVNKGSYFNTCIKGYFKYHRVG